MKAEFFQTRWRRWAAVWLVLFLALGLSGCGGAGGDSSSPPPLVSVPVNPVGAGQFKEVTPIQTLSLADIASALGTLGDQALQVKPRYGVAAYRMTYLTQDGYGQPITASALVVVPQKVTGASSPVLSYQHATTFRDDQAPGNKVEPVEPPIVLASLGYVVVSPDYVGFGAAKGLEHPYLTAAPSAAVVVDMLHAAQSWRQQNAVADNGQLFLAGYSEGGYVTLAAQRAIEQAGGTLRQQLQASVPGGGPYDVQATMDAQVEAVRERNSTLGKLFEPHRLSKAPEWVRQELRRLLLRQMIPDDADVRYQTLFLDRYMADDQAAIAAEHSVHLGWAPGVPVYLFHGRDDLTVPYAAATSALRTLQAAGARDISLTDCTTPDYGHLKCVPEYFRFAVERMGRLARDL